MAKDDLIRATFPADLEVRDANGNEAVAPTLTGHFARFNEWTEITGWEGNFVERIAPGAFAKTIAENRQNMRVLFQHGRDPSIGDKVLGVPSVLEEDGDGARYEVPLFDTEYVRELLPGLRAGAYGASFRFKVIREEYATDVKPSDYNPRGLPERTITEAAVREFGPVTFPAYEGATATVRAITLDELSSTVLGANTDPPADEPITIGKEVAAPSHPKDDKEPERRDTQPDQSEQGARKMSIDEMRARLTVIKGELEQIAAENSGMLDPDTQARWDGLKKERETIEKDLNADLERKAYLEALTERADEYTDGVSTWRPATGTGTYVTKRDARDKSPDDVFALAEYTDRARSQDHLLRLYTEGATRAMDTFHYPHSTARTDKVNEHLERLLKGDAADKEIAQRFIIMGSPTYRSAFFKSLQKMPLNQQEQHAMTAAMALEARALTSASSLGGVTVPVQIDPTLIPVSNGVLNPFRRVARQVTTTSYLWQGVTQGGVTFTYRAEGATMADNSPALVARPIQPERADAFIPFSWEAGADWGSLEAQLAEAIQDGKDAAENTAFSSGAGHASNQPTGILTGAGTVLGTQATVSIGTADLFALVDALPPRYQASAAWMATPALYHRIRMSQTGVQNLWTDSLQAGDPDRLLGYPAYKASSVGTGVPSGSGVPVASVKWAVLGDFSRYVIVDRVGLQVRYIDNVFSGNTAGGLAYPVGMSGIVAYYRNSAGVVDSNAFRTGTVT